MLAAILEDEPSSSIRGQQTAAGEHVEEDQQQNLSSSLDENDSLGTLLRGVVFGRSVRSSFATLHVVRVNDQGQALNDDDDDSVLMIRLQFVDNATALRSYCRRFCKLGDLLRVGVEDDTSNYTSNTNDHCRIEWQLPDERVETDWRSPRLVVHVASPEAAARTVPVVQRHYWSMPQCQRWQRLYLPAVNAAAAVSKRTAGTVVGANNIAAEQDYDNETGATGRTPPIWMDEPSAENLHIGNSSSSSSSHHGGLGKRTQGQYIASFLLHMMAAQHQTKQLLNKVDGGSGLNSSSNNNSIPSDPTQWSRQYDKLIEQQRHHSSPPPCPSLLQQARDCLNHGRDDGTIGGVLDVAGGSGHVSMALSLLGVRCTVVDPRENVGRLPKRDRKIYHRALKEQQQRQRQQSEDGKDSPALMNTDALTEAPLDGIYCQPIGSAPSATTFVPFGTLRAWFGTPPDGVDTSFRHPDQDNLAAVVDDDTLSRCTAIVALHPDEATDAIVDAAVRSRIPFLIVPCCVFHRLFTHRKIPHTGEPVSTYQDLLAYLMAKDQSIQKTILPFEGANTILWSCFADDEPLSKVDG